MKSRKDYKERISADKGIFQILKWWVKGSLFFFLKGIHSRNFVSTEMVLPKNEENIHLVQQLIWKKIFQLYLYYRYKTQLYSSSIMYHQTTYVFINLSMWIGSFNGKSQQKCFSCSYKWRLMISMLYLMLRSSITRFLWCMILSCTALVTMCLFKQLEFLETKKASYFSDFSTKFISVKVQIRSNGLQNFEWSLDSSKDTEIG